MSNSSLVNEKEEKQISFPSNLNNLFLVEEFIEKIQEELNVKEEVHGNILVAVTEAVNNSIKHGNKENQEKSVKVSAILENPFLLSITVEDEGPGFDYNALPDPTLPENWLKETGRGVFFIKNLTDQTKYFGNGNIVKMSFNI